MLDIKFIKENPDLIKDAIRKKHLSVDLDSLLELEEKRVSHLSTVESLRQEQNAISEKIAHMDDSQERQQLINQMRAFKDNLKEQEEELKKVMLAWQQAMLSIPNIPDMSVPEGADESENVPEKTWGEPQKFSFESKDHITLMTNLGMVDFERGAKTHGFRGYFLTGAGADLSWAIWNYARDFYGKRNFTPMMTPSIVKQEHFYGTGHLPNDVEDLFMTQDNDFLSGTAEVPLMGYHSDEILDTETLPRRYLAFSPCFRREAGSYGKDTKGLIRVHEFFKLEQLILCQASHEVSVKYFEEVNSNFEAFLESLEIPYRRLLICGGDLGASKVKQYDTEAWVPHEGTYRELSSASYYHDFQTRRFNIRYRDDGSLKYVHSINCTAVATPRILVSLIENHQQEDGSIALPDVLAPYMGKTTITP